CSEAGLLILHYEQRALRATPRRARLVAATVLEWPRRRGIIPTDLGVNQLVPHRSAAALPGGGGMGKKKSTARKVVPARTPASVVPKDLLSDVRSLIEQARTTVAQVVNAGLVVLYWSIGTRIRTEVLKGSRADYGQQIVATLSQELA